MPSNINHPNKKDTTNINRIGVLSKDMNHSKTMISLNNPRDNKNLRINFQKEDLAELNSKMNMKENKKC